LARRANFADSIKTSYSNVLLVDNGGFFPEDDLHQPVSWFLMDAMKVLGTDAVGCGDRDLRFGVQYLRSQIKRTGLSMVCANLYERTTKKPVLQPYVIKTVGTYKVGIFGLMSDKADLGPARDSIYTVEPSNVAKTTIAEMRKKGARVIVLLSQLGKVESEDLVTAIDGIDAVIVGRNVPLIQTGRLVKNTVACYGGEQGQYVGETILTFNDKGAISARENEMFLLGPEVGEKKEVADLVRGFEDGFNALLEKKAKEDQARANTMAGADSSSMAPDHFLGSDVCSRCHVDEAEQWKTTAHAKAWQTLVDRHKDATPDCIPCHVLGYKQAGGYGTMATNRVNVQCESCHGMGTGHEAFAASHPKVSEQVCQSCHNATTSPDFAFAKFKPYVDHTHRAGELPPLTSHTMMK